MLQHDQQRNRAPTPDHLQGLPLSQRQYDSMRKMQEKQRNQEYNDLLAKVLGLYVWCHGYQTSFCGFIFLVGYFNLFWFSFVALCTYFKWALSIKYLLVLRKTLWLIYIFKKYLLTHVIVLSHFPCAHHYLIVEFSSITYFPENLHWSLMQISWWQTTLYNKTFFFKEVRYDRRSDKLLETSYKLWLSNAW